MVAIEDIGGHGIVLHAGLPKTGSSALQRLLYDNRDALAAADVLYDGNVKSPSDPKHQWLADCLRDSGGLAKQDLGRLAGHGRAILSTESITNEFPTFAAEDVKAVSEALKAIGDACIVVVVRDATRWGRSYYKQIVINDRAKRQPHYRMADPYAVFAEGEFGRLLLDHRALAARMEDAFAMKVIALDYDRYSVEAIAKAMTGLDLAAGPDAEVNPSLPDEAAELMRQLNATMAGREEKAAWSRLFVKAGFGGNAVLETLAGRSTDDAVAALDRAKLAALRYAPNPPLELSEETFAAVQRRLLLALDEAGAIAAGGTATI